MLFISSIINQPQINTIDFEKYFDSILKLVGIFGALIAAFKAITELKEGRIQRERDYRWRQSNSAKQLIDEMNNNKFARDATVMIDWQGDGFVTDKMENITINYSDIKAALRVNGKTFTSKEKYIRDCLDSFLHYIEFMEQSINNQLFEYKDVAYPMEYFILKLKENCDF